MPRRAALWVRFSLLACVACSLLLLAAVGIARAEEPPVPYVAPSDRALQPELPELSACPSAEVPVLAEEEAEAVSPELRELGHLRIEQQEACKAQSDRLDQVIERLWWVTAQTLALDHPEKAAVETKELLEAAVPWQEGTQEDLHHLRGLFEGAFSETGSKTLRHLLLGGPEEGEPLPVLGEFKAAPSEADSELVSSVDASGEAIQTGLYLLCGLMVGFFFGFAALKLVDRGT